MHVSSDRSALMAEPTESVKRHQKITIRSLFSTNNAIHFQTSRNAKQIYILKKTQFQKVQNRQIKKAQKLTPKLEVSFVTNETQPDNLNSVFMCTSWTCLLTSSCL